MERSGSRWRQNALRSGVIVIGAIAFGYLSLQVGFKPFLEQAQVEASRRSESATREPDSAVEEEEQNHHHYKDDKVKVLE